MPKIITIGNQKGGVAKTTTCMSLGACLVEKEKKVLLVDLDPQSNLTMSAGIDPDLPEKSVYHLLLEPDSDFSSIIHQTAQPNLDIIPSDMGLALAEKDLYSVEGYENNLKNRLKALHAEYDFILVDCPPSLGILTLNALTAAEMVIIPIQCEYFSAKGVEYFQKIIEMIKERTNPSLTYKLLVTMYDQRNKICQSILGRLEEEFESRLFETIIKIDTKLKECAVAGQPINMYASRTKGAMLYRSLAEEVLGE